MRYLIGFLVLLLLFSCEKFEPLSENSTKVTVHMISPEKFELTITKDDFYDFNNKEEVVATAKIDDNGEFKFQFKLNEIGVFQIKQKNVVLLDRVYLFPGDELRIEVDDLNKDEITYEFKGKSGKANKFVLNLNRMYPKDNDYYNALMNPKVTEFNEWIDNRKKEMLDYYDTFFFKDTIPDFVKNYELSNINFEWAYTKNEWAILNYYYQPDKWNEPFLPADFWAFLEDLKIEEPYQHIFLGRYLESMVWDWHIKQVNNGVTPTAQSRELAKFEIAKSKFSGQTTDIALALCLNDIIIYGFDERMLEVLKKLMNEFKQLVQDKNYYTTIEKNYKKRLSILKGNPAPEFTLPNIFNAPISLNDFKGKTVYVFFWSLMYEPSLMQLQKLTELQLKYANSNQISIISVAMDEGGLEKWKKFLNEERLLGIQLYCEGLFNNKIASDYMINSIPFAFIVDKSGKINMMNAPYPGNEKLIGMLESL